MEDTLPKLLRQNYRKYGSTRVAMRRKDLGRWEPYTWEQYYDKVKCFCLGLVKLGLEPGDKVFMIGENAPEYFWAELATMAGHGVPICIYADSLPAEIKYIFLHSESKFAIAEDQEQVDKFLALKDEGEIPLLRKVIYWDPRGLWSYRDQVLSSFEEVLQLGRDYEKENPGLFDELVDSGTGEDTAIIMYTSGTTGLPKGVVQTQSGLIEGSNSLYAVNPLPEGANYVSYVSPAWVAEQLMAVSGSLLQSMTLFFPEAAETVQENIREVCPQFLFLGARLWESNASTVEAKILDSSRLHQAVYRAFIKLGYRVADRRFEKKPVNPLWQLLYLLGELIVYRPLKDKLGLMKIQSAYAAGSGISPSLIRYYHAIGVSLKQLYGLTEIGIAFGHWGSDIRTETVGKALPGYEVAISPEGEILIKSKALFKEYYKDAEATKSIVVDGWFHTGDAGHIDADGHLVVLDRVAEMEGLADGSRFSPAYIENRLRFSAYIKEAAAIGGKDKDYVTAIIGIDFATVSKWAESHHMAFTTLTDLSQKEQTANIVKREIVMLNQLLPKSTRIKKFVVLYKELDPDDAEMTRTRKLRRSVISERYSELVAAMYQEKEGVVLETSVTYRDGRKGVIKTLVRVWAIDEA